MWVPVLEPLGTRPRGAARPAAWGRGRGSVGPEGTGSGTLGPTAPPGRWRHTGWDPGREGSLLPDQMAKMLNY